MVWREGGGEESKEGGRERRAGGRERRGQEGGREEGRREGEKRAGEREREESRREGDGIMLLYTHAQLSLIRSPDYLRFWNEDTRTHTHTLEELVASAMVSNLC